jgi:hypothetical protein
MMDQLIKLRIETIKDCGNGSRFGYFEPWNNDKIMDGILVVRQNNEWCFQIWKKCQLMCESKQSEWNPHWKNTNAWHLLETEFAPTFHVEMLFPTIIWKWHHPIYGIWTLHEATIKTKK